MQNALNSKASSSDIPTKVSDLTNDSGFITNTVNNLTNYYTKTNTYTKSEVDSLIGSVSSLDIQIVQTLPTQDISTSTIYLVPKTASTNDNYDEYIYVNNSWEHIGSTEVDLSNYYTKTQTDNLLDAKVNANSLSTVAITGDYDDLSNIPVIDYTGSSIRVWDLDDGIYKLTNGCVVYYQGDSNISRTTKGTAYLIVFKKTSAWKDFVLLDSPSYIGYTQASAGVINRIIDDNDVTNNLNQTYEGYVLDARQGKILNETKQDLLVSGTNIKTINNQSLLGSGNIDTTGGQSTATDVRINGTTITDDGVANIITESAYNASTNKIATMSDLPPIVEGITTLTGSTINIYDLSNGLYRVPLNCTLYYTSTNYFTVSGEDGYLFVNRDYYSLQNYCFIGNDRIITGNTSYNNGSYNESLNDSKIANNLTTTGSGYYVLDAYQGKVLKDLIDAIVVPTKTSDLTNDSGFIDGLEILSYGNSNWNDFITAYQKNKVVYCRASSNSNPASGSQTRLAFMAYVNNATSPTEVEFQYYRSVSSHSDSQQGDQVFVYKLTSAGSWTVTTRNAFSKVVAGTGLSSSYSNGAITLSANAQTETDPVFSASAASGITSSDITSWNNKSNFSGSYNDLTNKPFYDASYVELATGSTITNEQYEELLDAIESNTVIKIGNSIVFAAADHSPQIVISWINYDQFFMIKILGDYDNHSVTYEYNGEELTLAIDGDFIIQSIDSTITNEQYQTLVDGLFMKKCVIVEGAIGHISIKEKDNAIYLVISYLTDNVLNEIWISDTTNNHQVTVEQKQLATTSDLATKQDSLVSGTNIKTVNNQSLLGSGDISITGGASNIENGTEEGDLQQTGSTASGGYSFAEGFLTTASGEISHTEGFQTTASGAYSHAEGNYTKAIGEQSHAEGYRTTASGASSHSEGNRTTASEGRAHAEGDYTTASGYASHAEGEYTTASGEGSHAEGEYTTAGGDYQHVFGKYNVIDNNSTYVEIVGNGNYNSGTQTTTRANARTLDWNGNEVLAGKLTVGANPTANMDVATKQYVDNNAGGEKIPIGTIFEFPTDDPTKLPTGYLFCDGSAVSRTTYADLFGVIGTTYGSGDGSTTFNLPSKEGLVTVGLDSNDTDFDTIGETGGSKELQAHNHDIRYQNPNGSGITISNTGSGLQTLDIANWSWQKNTANSKGSGSNLSTNTEGTGNSGNLQPYVVSNYIIKASNVSQLPDEAEVVDGYSTSTTDAYSANYVNTLNSYSTGEQRIGTWIDGKPIYRKTINFGALPNTNGKSVAHGISNLDFITDIRILSKNPTYSYYISIPYTNKSNVTYQIEFYIDNTNIVITTGDNKSGYSNTYIILEYTKTTD